MMAKSAANKAVWSSSAGAAVLAVSGVFSSLATPAEGAPFLKDDCAEKVRGLVSGNYGQAEGDSVKVLCRPSSSAVEFVTGEAGAVSIAEAVGAIKSNLGLPAKDVAKILGVSRPTFYAYLKEERAFKEELSDRVFKIYYVSKEIQRLIGKSPGPLLKTVRDNNNSLFELLVLEDSSVERINELAIQISHKMKQQVESADGLLLEQTVHELTRST